jgi:hypothetical protein
LVLAATRDRRGAADLDPVSVTSRFNQVTPTTADGPEKTRLPQSGFFFHIERDAEVDAESLFFDGRPPNSTVGTMSFRWLSRRQRERMEEPGFYELLQREIPRRLLLLPMS